MSVYFVQVHVVIKSAGKVLHFFVSYFFSCLTNMFFANTLNIFVGWYTNFVIMLIDHVFFSNFDFRPY